MTWTDEQKEIAEAAVKKNSEIKFSHEDIKKLEDEQANNWDKFYGIHQNRFFKDRHWLFTEFPELSPHNTKNAPERVYPEGDDIVNKMSDVKIGDGGRRIFEIGSGVGNSNLHLHFLVK